MLWGCVEGAPGHHCRCRRGPLPGRGGLQLRGVPVLDQSPGRPLPGRGRRRVRGPFETAPDVTERDTAGGGRPDPGAARGPGPTGPGRRPAHPGLAPATGTDHGLGGDGVTDPDPPRRRSARPLETAEELDAAVPGRAAQPAVAVRLHPLAVGERAGRGDPELAGRPLRYLLGCTVHRPVTGPVVVAQFRAVAAAHATPAGMLTDNGLVYTTRFAGGRRGQGHPQRVRARARRPRGPAENSSPNHPQTCGKSKASTRP